MVHPTGVPESNDSSNKRGLTGTLSLTAFRRVPAMMANLSGAPPALKAEAPDPAATGSSANVPNLAGGHIGHITAARTRIAGTLRLRLGGVA